MAPGRGPGGPARLTTDTPDTPTVRQCPTRLDGADPLIAHTISPHVCEARRREHYHKCPACTYHERVTLVPAARRPGARTAATSPGSR